MDSSLAVIIPNYNNIEGLHYLLSYFKKKPYEIIVVDNSKKNLGFAGGVNKGSENIRTKWTLILNDDIEFNDKEIINKLIQFAEEMKLDAVSPILRNPDGKVENHGYKVLPIGRINLVKELTGSRVNELDGLTAACLLVKTEVFKKLGGFDKKFFAYLEDVDFFLRFKKAGYKFGIMEVEVLHDHMTTTKTMGNFKARQDMINWWRLYFKHPEKFKFNLDFIIERLRNVSGYIKASLKK
ncbi:MAG: glycosyltransferase [Patescibacteria group bacterium]|jgi:GT2 family glycosyltransferase